MSNRLSWAKVLGVVVLLGLLVAACAPAAPTPTPTTAPAEPTPTTAPAEPTPTPEEVRPVAEAIDEVAPESLVAVCERVKEAVTFDDAAGTVTFNMADPFDPLMMVLAQGWGAALDMEWMAEQGDWDGSCDTWIDYYNPAAVESTLFNTANGTGPYKFEHWLPGEEWSIIRNDDYWRTEPIWEGGPSGPAAIERGVVKFVPEWSARLAMLEAGDADMAYVPRQYAEQADALVKEAYEGTEIDPAALTILNAAGTLRRVMPLPAVSARDMFFNQLVNVEGGNDFVGSGELDGNGIPPDFFSDLHIRKAFNYCFDWDTIIEQSELGEAFQRTGPIIRGMLGYLEDPMYTYDLAKCEEEFKLADIDKDGIPAGEDEEGDVWDTGFFFIMTYNTGNVQRKTSCEIIEQAVEAVNENFEVGVVNIPWPTYLQNMVGARLPMFLIGWLEDYHHPHNWVFPYLHSAGAFADFQSFPEELQAVLDAKIDECKRLSGAEAEACYQELGTLSQENAVNIWMIQPIGRHYEQLWVEGWYYNPGYPGVWVYPLSKAEGAKNPDTGILATIGEPATIDPNWMYDTASSELVFNIYDTLIFPRRESISEFVPVLATEVPTVENGLISADGMTWTFNIRSGVTFHEGGTLEPHDIAYSIWRGLLQDRSGGPQWMLLEPLLGVSAIESLALEIDAGG